MIQPDINVFTTTNQYLAPFAVDQILRDNYFFGRIMERTKDWNGSQMVFPIKYAKGVNTVAFNGFDQLPITQIPSFVNMTFWPTFTATNVALAGSDISINATPMQTMQLVKLTMESRAQDASDDIGNFLQEDGTSFGGKAPNGLANTVDNGTVAPTYGGLSRASYPGLNAYIYTSSVNVSLLGLRNMWNNISDGSIQPNFIGGDYTTWSYIESLQTPFQRNNQDFRPSDRRVAETSGYSEMRWDGMIISRDKKFTTGDLYMLNLETLNWYGLKWWKGEKVTPKTKDIKQNVYVDEIYNPRNAFTWTNFIYAYNQGAVNGFIILGGQLVCLAPFRNALWSGITGYQS